MVLSLILTFALAGTVATASEPACWKGSYGRGVGKPISACREGFEKNGALCYPTCRAGYYGVGPVCWTHCEQGWIDEGALCRKKGSIQTIAKKSYGRGAGTPLTCPAGTVEDAALCYSPCKPGSKGVGPVCWDVCPETDPVNGGALCCANTTVCDDKVLKLSTGLPVAVAKALLSGGDPAVVKAAVKAAAEAALGFVLPLCDASLVEQAQTFLRGAASLVVVEDGDEPFDCLASAEEKKCIALGRKCCGDPNGEPDAVCLRSGVDCPQ